MKLFKMLVIQQMLGSDLFDLRLFQDWQERAFEHKYVCPTVATLAQLSCLAGQEREDTSFVGQVQHGRPRLIS